MMQFPNIDPIALQIGPLKVYWYGLMYVVGFLSAWMLGRFRARQCPEDWSNDAVGDLIFYCALGVILGGRVGYILFYQFSNFLEEPLMIFKIWKGGMAFHGGLIGVIVAAVLYCRRYAKSFLTVMDFVAPLVPIGLAAGRIGNFINGELVGRETTLPWGLIFPMNGPLPRHPSEIYEFLLEGVLLFVILWIFSSKRRPVGAVSALFLLGYGGFRFIAECFRQPDVYLGFIAFDWMTMGQILSVPMVIGGVFLMVYAYWKPLKKFNETKKKDSKKRRAAKWKTI